MRLDRLSRLWLDIAFGMASAQKDYEIQSKIHTFTQINRDLTAQ